MDIVIQLAYFVWNFFVNEDVIGLVPHTVSYPKIPGQDIAAESFQRRISPLLCIEKIKKLLVFSSYLHDRWVMISSMHLKDMVSTSTASVVCVDEFPFEKGTIKEQP